MKALIPIALVAALSACASAPPAAPAPDPTHDALARSAMGVNRSIMALAEVEQYDRFRRVPGPSAPYPQVADMAMEVSLPWAGPVEDASRQLASHAGYQFKVTGRAPVIPVLVKIGDAPATVSDHLRNIGMQSGSRADVVVYPQQRLVELRYSDVGL